MTITTTLTARDKKLLVFLAAFILLAAVSLLVLKPTLESIGELDKQLADAELKQRQNAYSISQIDTIATAISKGEESLLLKTAELYPLMEAYEIDSLLTGEALRFGFDESNLRELTIQVPDGYTELRAYLQPPAEDEEPNAGLLPGIYAAEASLTLRGTREQLERFCDRLANTYPAIRVSAFYFEEGSTEEAPDSMTIVCHIYMCDKANTQAAAQTP